MELAETNTYMLTFKHRSTIYNVIGSTRHVISPRKPTEDAYLYDTTTTSLVSVTIRFNKL